MFSHKLTYFALIAALLLAGRQDAHAQPVELANRPVAEVKLEGLKRVSEQLVRNQIRTAKGAPYDPKVTEQDIRRITQLGQFSTVTVRVSRQNDNSVVVTFDLVEQPLLADVRVVGNKRFSDQEILGYNSNNGWVPGMVSLRASDGADQFLMEKGIQRIKQQYEDNGFYQVAVSIDEKTLNENGILIYKVREGPLVTIRAIKIEGNKAFPTDLLKSQIRSETAFLFFRKGHLSREVLDNDVSLLRDYYRDRGYLDAEVGRRVEISPDQSDSAVVFRIEEGALYTISSVEVEGNQIFSTQQIKEKIAMKVGDVYTKRGITRSQEIVYDMYGKLGHIDMRLIRQDGREGIDRIFDNKAPKVDVILRIREARPHFVGKIEIRGNNTTKDNVILREVRGMRPGRRFDRQGIELTQRRLRESSIFDQANVTILGDPDDEHRDVLIQVKEVERPGTLSFGAAISSDAGILGAIDLVQRNFDIADWPDDLAELFSGRAFRGAGQLFTVTLQPGAERQLYSVRFREPYILDSQFFLDTRFRLFTREREDFIEERLGGSFSVGQNFGDVWRAQLTPRFDQIDVRDVDPFAPVDIFAEAGSSSITGLAASVTRDTTNSRIFPTEGSSMTVGLERVGVFGGDFDFTRMTFSYRKYWKVAEDFFGRATVLSLKGDIGYIFEENEAPSFERFYAGGHRSFRGFSFRGVGPRGIIDANGDGIANPGEVVGDDPVGGDFQFLLGAEYNWPIYEEVLRGVVFIDSGTVQQDIGLDEYRVSIGAGIRLRVPFLGSAPFAFDVAIPIIKEDGDDTQFFSFDIALPF